MAGRFSTRGSRRTVGLVNVIILALFVSALVMRHSETARAAPRTTARKVRGHVKPVVIWLVFDRVPPQSTLGVWRRALNAQLVDLPVVRRVISRPSSSRRRSTATTRQRFAARVVKREGAQLAFWLEPPRGTTLRLLLLDNRGRVGRRLIQRPRRDGQGAASLRGAFQTTRLRGMQA